MTFIKKKYIRSEYICKNIAYGRFMELFTQEISLCYQRQ